MKINLAYGKNGLVVNLSDEWDVTVIEPTFVPQVPDPGAALTSALRNPINSQPLHEIRKCGGSGRDHFQRHHPAYSQPSAHTGAAG
jgi:hypothetical protein